MRCLRLAVVPLAAFLSLLSPALAQGIITTVAGGGPNNMLALSASLSQPGGVAVDAAGNMYVVTASGNRVFKVNAAGQLTIFAGVGNGGRHWQAPWDPDFGGDGGPATDAYLYGPNRVAVDSGGNLLIADTWNQRIRRVDAVTGIISTVAGTGSWAFGGDGGPATAAGLALPSAIALDSTGNLFIADRLNNRIRRVDAASGFISTVAGNGQAGFSGDGGPATSAALRDPLGVAVDAGGNIFIADMSNNRIRRVDAITGIITTVAGNVLAAFAGDGGPATNALLNHPWDVDVDSSGNIFIADAFNDRIRRVDAATGIITTIAGTGFAVPDVDNQPAVNTSLNWPRAVRMDPAGNVLIADSGHHRIRRIDAATGIITTIVGNGTWGFSGDNQIATEASLFYPQSLARDIAGNLFIADWGNFAIRRLDAATGFITTVAGNGTLGIPQDGAPAISAIFNPMGVAVDAALNIYVSQPQLHRIIRVDGVLGTISTIAGYNSPTTFVSGFSGDGGPAADALLNSPTWLTLDADGNLFFSDSGNFRIRRIDAATGIITTVVGNGINGYGGDGGPATSASLGEPRQLAFDRQGNLFFADMSNNRVRRVDALTGIITTVAGNGTNGPLEEGVLATSTSLVPVGLALDAGGNLFVTEATRIRRIDAYSGIIHTIAGGPVEDFSGDGGPPIDAFFNDVEGLLLGASHTLFVCDRWNNRVRAFPIPNAAPAANAGPDQIVEATGVTTPVTLNGSGSSDPDGDVLSFEWRDASNVVVGSTAVITLSLPLGTQTFTLTVTDPSGASSSDTVNITVRDTTPPAVTVTAPNGGEKLLIGTPYSIQWNASDAVGISSFDVYFSSNSGLNFSPVPGCTALAGAARTCTWTAPGPVTTTCRIRVIAYDASGNSAFDTSDKDFTIFSISSPTLNPLSPNKGALGTAVAVTFSGTNFVPGFTSVSINTPGVTISNLNFTSSTAGTATFIVAANAQVGDWQVTVTTPGGTSGIRYFSTYGIPAISSISPATGNRGTSFTVTLTGSNFFIANIAISGTGVTASNKVNTVPYTQMTYTFTIASTAAPGPRTVTLSNAAGTSNPVTFTVNGAAPTLTSVSPNNGNQGATLQVTLTGTNFVSGATVGISGTGVTANNVVVVNSTTITANFVIAAAAPTGATNVTVTTVGGTSNAMTFTVSAATSAPSLNPLSPNKGALGTAVAVTFSGTNFVPGFTSVSINTPGVTISNLNFTSSTAGTATFIVAANAQVGDWQVTVTTPGGTSGIRYFSVYGLPVINSIIPDNASRGATFTVTLTGSNFFIANIAISGTGVTASNKVNTVPYTQMTYTLTIASTAAPGPRTVTLSNAAGTSNPVTFTVN